MAVPGELFVELGLDLKRRSPFPQTMVVELTNDSIGYIPTAQAFEEGGYEPSISFLQPGEGERLVGAGLELLHTLHRS